MQPGERLGIGGATVDLLLIAWRSPDMSGMPWFAADERVSDARDLRPALLTQTVLDAWYQRRGFVMHRSSLGVVEFGYPRAPYDAQPPVAADAPQVARR